MEKSLNEIYETLITDEKLTDDILKTFRDIDVMMSLGMMAWMFKTCKEVDEKLKSGKYITYNKQKLNHEGFKKILTENLSDYCIRQIFD